MRSRGQAAQTVRFLRLSFPPPPFLRTALPFPAQDPSANLAKELKDVLGKDNRFPRRIEPLVAAGDGRGISQRWRFRRGVEEQKKRTGERGMGRQDTLSRDDLESNSESSK